MKNNVAEFEKIFNEVKEMNWVETKRNGPTGVGYTFESLINLEENSFSIADFNGIEIKTKRYNTRGYITLFSVVPDGDYLFSLKELYEQFGYPHKLYKNYNVLNVSIRVGEYTRLRGCKKLILKVDDKNEKIIIDAYDNQRKIHNNNTSWSFKLLKDILIRKLSYLAFIKAHNKFINKKEFFKYDKLVFYELLDFNRFIELIKKNKIRLTIKIGINNSAENFGKMKCHGCSFDIEEKDLDYLFKRLNN